MNEKMSGRSVAYFTLVLTLLVSVVANVTHSVLAASEVTLRLRVPGAMVWPVLSFLAIEIIVRIEWTGAWTHVLARVMVLGPAVPAVIVSYEHQNKLLTLMGEVGIVPIIGPVAIDGLMIGCTLALLFTRPVVEPAAVEIVEVPAVEAEAETAEESAIPAPVPAPAIEPAPARERAPRTPRQRDDRALLLAVDAVKDGRTPAEAAAASGMSVQAVRRYAAIVRVLRERPHAEVPLANVRADVVEGIRAWAKARV